MCMYVVYRYVLYECMYMYLLHTLITTCVYCFDACAVYVCIYMYI